jgi:hypothetical protein
MVLMDENVVQKLKLNAFHVMSKKKIKHSILLTYLKQYEKFTGLASGVSTSR